MCSTLPDSADAFVDASTPELLIDGDSGDVVHSVGQGWVRGADVGVNGALCANYAHDPIAAELPIASVITRDIG